MRAPSGCFVVMVKEKESGGNRGDHTGDCDGAREEAEKAGGRFYRRERCTSRRCRRGVGIHYLKVQQLERPARLA